jgi:hypothetical protein
VKCTSSLKLKSDYNYIRLCVVTGFSQLEASRPLTHIFFSSEPPPQSTHKSILAIPARLSAMSDDPYHYVELSEDWNTRSGDPYAGDTSRAATSEHPIICDEDGGTEYSDFCDDETISAAPATCYPADPSPATTLGKRKSFDRSEPSSSLSASYKRQTISDDGAEPYIIVCFPLKVIVPGAPKAHPPFVDRRTTPASNARWTRADFLGASNGKSRGSSHLAIARGMISPCQVSISSAWRGCPRALRTRIPTLPPPPPHQQSCVLP